MTLYRSLRRGFFAACGIIVCGTAPAGTPSDLDIRTPPPFCSLVAFTAGKVANARDGGTTKPEALERNRSAPMSRALPEKLIDTIYAYRDVPGLAFEAYAMWTCHANANGVDVMPMRAIHADMERCFAKPPGDPCVRDLRNRAMGLPPIPAGQSAPATPDMLEIRHIPVVVAPPPAVVTREPLPGSCEKPGYPQAALVNRDAGTVTLRFLIDAQGTVIDGKVLKSSGFASLDREALTALGRCKYAPFVKNGQPDSGLFQISYSFAPDAAATQ